MAFHRKRCRNGERVTICAKRRAGGRHSGRTGGDALLAVCREKHAGVLLRTEGLLQERERMQYNVAPVTVLNVGKVLGQGARGAIGCATEVR